MGWGWGWGRCKQHIKHMCFDLLQLLRGFLYWKDHQKKKNGQVLNKPQMKLLSNPDRQSFTLFNTAHSFNIFYASLFTHHWIPGSRLLYPLETREQIFVPKLNNMVDETNIQ